MFSNKNIFKKSRTDTNRVEIGTDARVIFVSDAFVETYQGGAELSTDALLRSAPEGFHVACVPASQITMEDLAQYQDRFWVFFNIGSLQWELIPSIVANLDYAVVEYDYKFCKWRSPEKHLSIEGVECNCHEEMHGKLYSSLLLGAKKMFWMSEAPFFSANKAIFSSGSAVINS